MPVFTMQELQDMAVALLPTTGGMEFEAYKAKVYAELPDNGRDILSHLLRNGVVGKRVAVVDHKAVVTIFKK